MPSPQHEQTTTKQPDSCISDDECVDRLSAVIEAHGGQREDDTSELDQAARLIGRLAIPLEI